MGFFHTTGAKRICATVLPYKWSRFLLRSLISVREREDAVEPCNSLFVGQKGKTWQSCQRRKINARRLWKRQRSMKTSSFFFFREFAFCSWVSHVVNVLSRLSAHRLEFLSSQLYLINFIYDMSFRWSRSVVVVLCVAVIDHFCPALVGRLFGFVMIRSLRNTEG